MHGTTATDFPALSIEHVSHSYGTRRALDDVSLTVAPGTFAVLLGLNGAGKSTLFALITRLYATRSGCIRIFNHDIEREPGEALRRLGVVFQSRTLDLDLSLRQNLLYHAALHGIDAPTAHERADEALVHSALSDRAGDKARNLSGGQMRRVEIARALLHRPHLLVLDEPTAGLDIRARADILDHVRRLVADKGIGVLWATHLIDEIADGDQVIVMHRGHILANGAPQTLIGDHGARDLREAFALMTGAETTPATGDAA